MADYTLRMTGYELENKLAKINEIDNINYKVNNITSDIAEANTKIAEIKDLASSSYDFITPEMFGAVGNGKDDDTEAFKAAIESVSKIPGGVHSIIVEQYRPEPDSNFGKTILLGNKTYYLKDGLDIDKFGVTIVGCGTAVRDADGQCVGTVIKTDDGAGYGIKISATHVTLKNVIVKGSKKGFKGFCTSYQEINLGGAKPYMPMATNLLLENCHFYGASNAVSEDITGFYLSAPVLSKLVGCTATNCTRGFMANICKRQNGTKLESLNGTTLELNHCWARDVGYTGYHLDHCYYCVLNNCACDISQKYGYVIENSRAITLNSCGAEQIATMCAATNVKGLTLNSPFATAVNGAFDGGKQMPVGDFSILKVAKSVGVVIIGGNVYNDGGADSTKPEEIYLRKSHIHPSITNFDDYEFFYESGDTTSDPYILTKKAEGVTTETEEDKLKRRVPIKYGVRSPWTDKKGTLHGMVANEDGAHVYIRNDESPKENELIIIGKLRYKFADNNDENKDRYVQVIGNSTLWPLGPNYVT